MMNCERCGKELANTSYTLDHGDHKETICPLCHLGKKEGSHPKYWDTRQEPYVNKVIGVDGEGKDIIEAEKPVWDGVEWDDEEKAWKLPLKG